LAATHPESLLLSATIRSGEHQQWAKFGITSALFHVHRDEAEFVEKYIQKNGKTPSKAAMKQMYPDLTIWKVDDTAHWCEEVHKSHKRQYLIDLMDDALNMVDANEEERAVAMVEQGVQKLRLATAGQSTDFDVFDNWGEVYDSVSARVDRVRLHGYAGVPTGFDTLDKITGGMQPGWFGVIAARLGQGKTWTGVRMGYTAATSNHKVVYFSLEQSKLQIAMRVHAFGSRQYAKEVFNPMDLNRGKGFDIRNYKQFLMDMRDQRGSGKFIINDTSRGLVTPATVARVIEMEQPDICFIDYLTLLGASSDDWRGTAKLSSEIQSTAQRYDLPIMALSQVNRLGIGKEPPGAEHLSQADAIGQDADLVLTMNSVSKTVQKMRLAKFRHGAGGDTWYAKFSPGTGEYDEISKDKATDIVQDEQDDD
jgi:replicative DNA helicase